MEDRITKATQAAIEKLRTQIDNLERDLSEAKADLKVKEEILRLATLGLDRS